MTPVLTKCQFCDYSSVVKCNVKRHQNSKHKNEMAEIANITNIIIDEENVVRNEENVVRNEENVVRNEENVVPNSYICEKCNRMYKTMKYLLKHKDKCIGLDNLTCPKCMKSFSNRSNKCNHIKRNTCKARSIIHARTPNVQNITNNTINNINIEKQFNNNIYINNFGSERIDHISKEEIYNMLTSGINTIPLYIEKKHFDKDFPENNNIAFTNENKCKVMENNAWKEKDLGLLSSKLIHDNSEVLLLYCEDNEIELSNHIQNNEVLEHVKDKLVLIYNKADSDKYNQVLGKIKDLVKNSK